MRSCKSSGTAYEFPKLDTHTHQTYEVSIHILYDPELLHRLCNAASALMCTTTSINLRRRKRKLFKKKSEVKLNSNGNYCSVKIALENIYTQARLLRKE